MRAAAWNQSLSKRSEDSIMLIYFTLLGKLGNRRRFPCDSACRTCEAKRRLPPRAPLLFCAADAWTSGRGNASNRFGSLPFKRLRLIRDKLMDLHSAASSLAGGALDPRCC